jgi:hypothetical protein
LAYFIFDSAPEILVDDPTENQTISLSELFAVDVKGDSVNEELEFEQEKLQLTHLRRYSSAPSEHVIHLCADQREVCQLRLATEIKALSDRLVDGKGSYFYACYVQGRLLDTLVNSQRTGFNFAQGGSCT